MADQLTHQIAGLIEHAELCQQAATDARRALDAGADKLTAASDAARRTLTEASTQLDKRIADAVDAAVREKLANTPSEIKTAVTQSLSGPLGSLQTASGELGHAIGRLGWQQAAIAACVGFGAILAAVVAWVWLVPSAANLAQMRADEARLERIAARCGPEKQLCVRVYGSQAYGKTADWYIVRTTP